MIPPLAEWNPRSSSSVNKSWRSSTSVNCITPGIKCNNPGSNLWLGGSGMGPRFIAGWAKIAHHRSLLAGHCRCRKNTDWWMVYLVSLANCLSICWTHADSLAPTVHSITMARLPKWYPILSKDGKLSLRGSCSALWSPNFDHGWHAIPPMRRCGSCAWLATAATTCGWPMSPNTLGTSVLLEVHWWNLALQSA